MNHKNRSIRPSGLGPHIHLANPKMCDFSVPKEMYNFQTMSVVPDLSYLRKPLQIDWDMARRLFIGNADLGNVELDIDKARELFVPNIPRSIEETDDEEDEWYDEDEVWDDDDEYWD